LILIQYIAVCLCQWPQYRVEDWASADRRAARRKTHRVRRAACEQSEIAIYEKPLK